MGKLRIMAGIAGALALGGCVVSEPAVTSAAHAPRAVAVAGANVVVAGPAGYCVDSAASHDLRDGAFVVLGACQALGGQGPVKKAGVLTATVAAPDRGRIAGNAPQLGAFFASDAGRRALSRAGQAESVDVLETRAEGDVLYLHLRDSAGAGVAGTTNDYWRAMFDVNDRIATVSVLSFADAPRSASGGLTLARAFTRKIRSAN